MSWFNGKLKGPDAQWFAERENETYFTPDANMLEQRPWQNLFLYGEDRPDIGNNMAKMEDHILDAPTVAFTRDHFSMYRKELGAESYPIALSQRYGFDHFNSIKGYWVIIRSSQLYELDNYRQNGKLFIRKRVRLLVPYTRTRWVKQTTDAQRGGTQPPERLIKKISAHMYVGNPDYWGDHIDAGYLFKAQVKTVSKSPWMEDYISYEHPPF